jgi:phage-related protein
MKREKEKPIEWIGSSKADISTFVPEARRQAGFEIDQVCIGNEPSDWKPMATVGPGSKEIRFSVTDGGKVRYRIIYVAKFEEAVYVLHAFEKTTEQTSPHDIALARSRYKEVIAARTAARSSKK